MREPLVVARCLAPAMEIMSLIEMYRLALIRGWCCSNESLSSRPNETEIVSFFRQSPSNHPRSADVGQTIADIVTTMWATDPLDRPSCNEVVRSFVRAQKAWIQPVS